MNQQIIEDVGLTKNQQKNIMLISTQLFENIVKRQSYSNQKQASSIDLNKAIFVATRECAESVLNIYTVQQQDRLWQIVRQVRGLDFIYVHEEMAEKLSLTARQQKKIKTICFNALAELSPLYNYLLRSSIAGIEQNETIAVRNNLMTEKYSKFKKVLKKRDTAIYKQLSKSQKMKLLQLFGEPFLFKSKTMPLLCPTYER